MASTTALPPPTCTARQEAGQLHRLAVLLRGLYRPDRLLFVFACNGLVQQAVFACPPLPCHTYCPRHSVCPVLFCILPPLFITMCARIVAKGCEDCPVGSYNTGLQWRPVHRVCVLPVHQLCSLRVPLELARRLHLRSSCTVLFTASTLKGGGPGLHVSSRPRPPRLHFMSQRLHASSLAPC